MTDGLPYVTRATSDDAQGLTICIDAAYAPHRAAGIDLPPVSCGVAEDIAQNHVWVARDGAVIAGGLILQIDGSEAYLKNVAVHPAYGSQGIGGALMRTALDAARAAGCRVIQLTTHAAMPGNIALYQHLGWHETRREGNKVAMQRSLDEG